MKVCHEPDCAACAEVEGELRGKLAGEMLAPAVVSYADAPELWGTTFAPRPGVATAGGLSPESAMFGRFVRGPVRSGTARARVPGMAAPSPVRRTRRPDLKTEIERLLARDWPELATERFLSAVLVAGLAATMGEQAKDVQRLEAPSQVAASVLTRREREVAALIAAGRTNRSIADELYIAQSTVERHVANMLNKLAFNSRTQIAAWAVANGLATSS